MPSAENPENSQCDDAQGERHARAGGCLSSYASDSVSATSRALVLRQGATVSLGADEQKVPAIKPLRKKDLALSGQVEVSHAPRDNVPTPPLHVKKMPRARDCFSGKATTHGKRTHYAHALMTERTTLRYHVTAPASPRPPRTSGRANLFRAAASYTRPPNTPHCGRVIQTVPRYPPRCSRSS